MLKERVTMKKDIPLVSIGFDGYELESVLKGLSKTKSKNIILCAIDGFTKHVVPEEMTIDEWKKVKLLVEKYKVSFVGLFGHCNIAVDDDMKKMKKRMEFTSFMGGKYIDTNSGPKGMENSFYKNIKDVINLAEELDLTVFIETHGDMLDTGKAGNKLLKKVNSERIKIGYDPANVTFTSNGKVDVAEDIKYAMDYLGTVHFKGIYYNKNNSTWYFHRVKDSSINYDNFFKILESYNYNKMVAIEIEDRLSVKNGEIVEDPDIWPEEKIINAYNAEIEYLNGKLFWM